VLLAKLQVLLVFWGCQEAYDCTCDRVVTVEKECDYLDECVARADVEAAAAFLAAPGSLLHNTRQDFPRTSRLLYHAAFVCLLIVRRDLVCVGDGWRCSPLRLEAQLKCGALEKDLKESAALNDGRIEYLLAEALLFKTRLAPRKAGGRWVNAEGSGCCSWFSLIMRRFCWICRLSSGFSV